MRLHPLAAGTLLAFASVLAHGQSLKPGLWEINNKTAGNAQMEQGMAQMQQQLANMPPEQRQQVEAMMAQRGVRIGSAGPGGMSMQVCMTREMVERNDVPMRDGCTATRQERHGSTMHVAFTCATPPSSGEGEFTFASPESYRSHMSVRTSAGGQPQTIEMDSTGKWLGADCGTIKPLARGK